MRAVIPAILLGVLSACSPQIPDSGTSVGFGTMSDADRARELELAQGAALTGRLIQPSVVSEETLAPVPGAVAVGAPLSATVQPGPSTVAGSAEEIAAETAAALAAASGNSGVEPIYASPSNPAPVIESHPAISDENDFGAVAERQTIESDADRIAQNRAQYQVIAPAELPERTAAETQPNVVAYALQTQNDPGTRVYSRSGLNMQAKAARNCASYPSPDQAQIAFLAKGGPTRDRLGLDPDGDGFACGWDPRPFRRAVPN